ncbi:MAG: hypothetical protein GYB67_05865 [Chloroflexi bacterium]|nr:hypothetical protein [Chloroflexota bacterium]
MTDKPKREQGIFQKHLRNGEHILWTAQPVVWHIFDWADVIAFAVTGGLFAVLVGYVYSFSILEGVLAILLIVVPILVLVIAVHVVYRYAQNLRTYYAVTDQRVMMIRRFPWNDFWAVDARLITEIKTINGLMPSGSLYIESQGTLYSRPGRLPNTPVQIADVAEADTVRRMIEDQRHGVEPNLAPPDADAL